MGSGDARYLGAKWSLNKFRVSIFMGSYSVARRETPAMDPKMVVSAVCSQSIKPLHIYFGIV